MVTPSTVSVLVKAVVMVSPALAQVFALALFEVSLDTATTGATVSTVSAKLSETGETLPAASVALAVRVCAPSAKLLKVRLNIPELSATPVPRTVLPSVSYTFTVDWACAVPVTV